MGIPAMAARRLQQLYPILQRCAAHQFYSTQSDAIQVTPKVSLFDQPVHIKVQGLPSNAKVTLHSCTQQEWRQKPVEFMACSQFITNEKGELDLARDPSLNGTYTGVEPMGLFWSLVPSPSGLQNIRMVVRNGDEPIFYKLSVYLGHIFLQDLVSPDMKLTPIHSTTVERWKKSADVQRITVRAGNVRGTLFLPAGDGPFPGVIDMFGSSGGLMEIRASLLASHGFAALSLPFVRYDDLPLTLGEITFDYFEEAAEWLSSHPSVNQAGIGVVGVSKGAELALLMAWKCPQVKAVVCINGPPFYWIHDIYRKDGTLVRKGAKLDLAQAEPTEMGLVITRCFPHTPEDIIPVWETSAHILALISEDDHQVDPAFIYELVDRYPPEKRHLVNVVRYPGAGHLLEPPYIPHCKACHNPSFGMDFLWGGNPKDHGAAQWDSWQKILSFLKSKFEDKS